MLVQQTSCGLQHTPLQQLVPLAQQTMAPFPDDLQETCPAGQAPQVDSCWSMQIWPAGQQTGFSPPTPQVWLAGQQPSGAPVRASIMHTSLRPQQVLPQHTLKGGQQVVLPGQTWLGDGQQVLPLRQGAPVGQHCVPQQVLALLSQQTLPQQVVVPAGQHWVPQQVVLAAQQLSPQTDWPVGHPQKPSGAQAVTPGPQQMFLQTTIVPGQQRSEWKQLSLRPQQEKAPPHGTGQQPPPGSWQVPQHTSQIPL